MGCEQLIERKKSRIIVEQDNGEPIVAGDRTQLLQLIQNLVVNALKYGRDSEDVTVRFEGAGPDMIRMSVIDRGEGIAPEHLDRKNVVKGQKWAGRVDIGGRRLL